MKRILILSLLTCLLAGPAYSFYFGNPGRAPEETDKSFKPIYDFGRSEVKDSEFGGATTDLETQRLTLQYNAALTDQLAVFGRGIPLSGRTTFRDTDLSPNVWGVGAGIQYSPERTAGPVRFGAVASGDWMQGSQTIGPKDLDATFLQGSAAAGASVPIIKAVSLYGGVSAIADNIKLEVKNGARTDLQEENLVGGFIGMDFLPRRDVSAGLEVHLINESAVNLLASYAF